MPYTSMPAWPTLSDQEVSDLAYFITTFSPDFSNPEKSPPARRAPERAESHEGVHRAREEALRRDRLRQVPRHARSGRRTFGSNAEGRLGPSDPPGGPRAELDLPGRIVPRGHLQDDDHGVQRHADAVVRSTPSRPSSDGRSRTSSSPLGEQRAWLFQPRRRQARPGSDRSGQGGRELRIRACGPLSDRRADHGARTRVPSARDQRHRSGDLRCGFDRPPRSMARHERGEDGEERAVASRAARGGGRGSDERGRGASQGQRLWRRGSRCHPSRPGAGPLCRGSGASRPAIRVLRRRRGPDSVAGADGRPQALLHLRRRPELGGSLVLRSGPPRSSSVHRQGKRGRSRPTTTGDLTGVASYDQGEWSVIFKRPLRATSGASFSPGEFMPIAFSVWDGFSRERGNRRGLTLWYSLYVEPEKRPIGRRPDGEDGAAHSRHRAGRDRLGAAAFRALAAAAI